MEITDFNMSFFSLQGKTALVTGGNSGLGRAFSLALAKAGADIFVAALEDDGGETARLVAGAGGAYALLCCDITAKGAPKEAVEACVGRFGGIDILVNCAGICTIASVEDFGRAEWDPMLAVNLTAAFEMSHEAAHFMIPQKSGKIINICSLFSYLGGLGSPAYAAAKHGLAGLTKAYADELAVHNIQVNGIAPGYFETAVSAASHSDPERYRRIVEHIPAGRWGDVADLMGAAVFLASPASDYVNGHLLVVDGGYLVR